MKQRSIFVWMIAMLWQSLAFSQTNPLIRYLPDDATTVIQFDIMRMGSKIPGETFRQSFIYRQMMKNPDMPFASLFSDPEKSGIDLSAGVILALKYQGQDRYDRNQPIVNVFIKLKNAETFTNNIKKLMGSEKEVEENETEEEKELIKVYGTDRILSMGGQATAGWNNDIFVLTTGYSSEMMEEIRRYNTYDDTTIVMSDTVSVATIDTAGMLKRMFDYDGMMERFKKSQRELCFQLLAPKSASALMNNTYFTRAMNSEADIKTWSAGGGNPIMESFPFASFASVLEKLETLSGKNSTALINFENGKIVMHGHNYPEGIVADIYKKYPTASQNMDLAKRLPPGILLGLGNLSFNQQMAGELLQKSGLLPMLDSLKDKIPFDLSLIPGVFKSNIMVAVIKSDITTTTDEITSKLDGFQLIIALPIADKAKFEKLKPAAKAAWDSLNAPKEDDDMFERKEPKDLFAKHNDELLVLSLSPQTATDFLNNKGTGVVPTVLQEYSKHPIVVSVNLREILANTGKHKNERMNKGMNDALLQKFDQVLFYGGAFENESAKTVFEFRFSNKEENSLKQLFEILTTLAETNDSREMEDEETYMMDTTIMMDTTVAMDTAIIMPVPIIAPNFKDPEVQKYANDYAAYINEYITLLRKGDLQKLGDMGKKGDPLVKQSEKIGIKVAADPEESKKLTDWMTEVSQQLTLSVQNITLTDEEVDIPPPPPPKTNPPKVEMKKAPTPPKKNN